MDTDDKIYNDQVNFLQSFFEFHPAYLKQLTSTERSDLSIYFFAGRKIDVADIFDYRSRQLAANPNLQDRAKMALKKLWRIAHIEGEPPLTK